MVVNTETVCYLHKRRCSTELGLARVVSGVGKNRAQHCADLYKLRRNPSFTCCDAMAETKI